MTASGTSFSAVADQTFTGQVASFSDANPCAVAADFTATINWGDGNVSPGTITSGGNGGFIVTGSNSYAAAGTFAVGVTINDVVDGATQSTASTATVAGAPLKIGFGALTPGEVASTAFSGAAANFPANDETGWAGST